MEASNTRDFFSQMRECLQGLELSLRRSRNGVDAYMALRKTLNKLICKYLRNFKKQGNKSKSNSEIAVLLKGVEEISTSMFESILSFISQPKSKSKLSIFTKFLQPKNESCKEEVEVNEMEKIDAELHILKSKKKSSNDSNQRKSMLKEIEALEMSLKEAEEDLECVYRRLVKIRVSILNSLNH
ncbi:uncharacterized protein LOC126657802 isoform X3 [Mercurialis annua]|uniref:uncharacterized protein LOC126657802 isoform X3 n=1 Tax=Mercurialis annua TaxID=3986 RepID=UPI002160E263|nr:uncharacterized protein LOC126657802 isoform X3 [Mercurialis annua]